MYNVMLTCNEAIPFCGSLLVGEEWKVWKAFRAWRLSVWPVRVWVCYVQVYTAGARMVLGGQGDGTRLTGGGRFDRGRLVDAGIEL